MNKFIASHVGEGVVTMSIQIGNFICHVGNIDSSTGGLADKTKFSCRIGGRVFGNVCSSILGGVLSDSSERISCLIGSHVQSRGGISLGSGVRSNVGGSILLSSSNVSLLGGIDRNFFSISWNDISLGVDGGSLDVIDLSLGLSSFFLLNLFGFGWSDGVLGSVSLSFHLMGWFDNLSIILVFLE